MTITVKNGKTEVENPEDKDNIIYIEGDGNIKKNIVQKSGGNNSITITGNENTVEGIIQG